MLNLKEGQVLIVRMGAEGKVPFIFINGKLHSVMAGFDPMIPVRDPYKAKDLKELCNCFFGVQKSLTYNISISYEHEES